tara:strand:+ start:68 stop:1315 length:1248 start_codon:yes stop_codon:yes gene_type:complete
MKVVKLLKIIIIYLLVITYSLELLTTLFISKKYDFIENNFDEVKLQKIKLLPNFDTRPEAEVFFDEKKRTPELSTTFRLAQFHLYNQDLQNKIKNFLDRKINNKKIIPFRGPINKLSLGDNEDGKRRLIKNDRYGFKNPNNVYEKNINLMILGDSFAEGVPFDEENDIAGYIRNNSKYNAINFGVAGSGPLLSLAIIEEYGKIFKPKDVFYLFYEGNDMDDLLDEEKTFLIKYLDKYNQKLFTSIEEKNYFLDEFEKIMLEILNIRNSNLTITDPIKRSKKIKFVERIRDFFELTALKNLFTDRKFIKKKANYNLLNKVIKKMNNKVKKWDANLHFVYIPSWNRYNNKYALSNFTFKNKIKKIVIKNNINFIDIVDEFKNIKDINEINLYNLGLYGHFNKKGYEIVSKKIINSLN